MMSNYDAVAQHLLQTNPPPHNYIVDVVEKDDEPGLVYLRLYADDINSKPDSYAGSLTVWLNAMLNQLNNHPLIVGKYTWEMAGEAR